MPAQRRSMRRRGRRRGRRRANSRNQAATATPQGTTAPPPAATPPPVAAAPEDNLHSDDLTKLAALRDEGVISDEDFEKKKNQLLGI